jgi:hypothetical protein
MLAGDATWVTRKVILGWLVDMVAMKIQLPSHRMVHLFEIIDTIGPHQQRTTVNKWQIRWGGATFNGVDYPRR